MKKDIYIHVGAGKTGTTAIQEFLFLNEKQLLKNGVYIPIIGRSASKTAIAHHELAAYDLLSNQQETKQIIRLWEKIATNDHSKLLISSELFHSAVKFKNCAEYLSMIKDILSNHKIYIIFYIRREDDWLQSAYVQWVKYGTLQSGISIHHLVQKNLMRLPEQIMIYAEIFGKESVIVKPYEKQQFNGGNIFSDFLNIFGVALNCNYILPKKNTNPGITTDALEFKRVYNTVCKNRQEAQMLMEPLLAYSELVDSNSTKIFSKKNLLSKEERDYLLEPLLPLYSKIAKEFLNRDDGILFYDLDTNCGFVNTENEDTTKVIAYLLKELYRENIQMKKEIELLKKRVRKPF